MESQYSKRTCSICVKIFQNRAEHLKHRNLVHNTKNRESASICHLCEKSFLNKNNLSKHIAFSHTNNPDEGVCDQCEKTFANRYQLVDHKHKSHVEKKYSCDLCNLKFSSGWLREQHVKRKHLKLKDVACQKCAYKGFSVQHLRIHIINKHSDFKPYSCELCPMAFSRVVGLYQHKETHENAMKNSKDIPCAICGKMFISKKGAGRCEKKHQSEGRYKCRVENCEATFNGTQKRNRHQKKAHVTGKVANVEVYPCHKCDKAFKYRPDLKRHIKYVHEKPAAVIACSICPTKCVSEARLKRHLLIHNGSVFKCPFEGCETTCNLKYNLNTHYKEKHGKVASRKSLEEKKAQEEERNQRTACSLCKKMIRRGKCKERNMLLHLKSHENQNSMLCIMEGCSQKIYFLEGKNHHTYNVPSSLYDHLTKEHDVSMETHTVCVDFKCKHCDTILIAKSSSSEKRPKFWFQDAKLWSAILAKHMTKSHETLAHNLNLKKDWKRHYEKGLISLKERRVPEKETLKQILDTLKCKLCDFKASGSYSIRKNPLLKHYCREHFWDPMKDIVKSDIVNEKCIKCNNGRVFRKDLMMEKLEHIAYNHGELYTYLRFDSTIDLTQFVKKRSKELYPCKECGKICKQKSNLKNHMIYHNDERPFACEHCEKAFKFSRDLRLHTSRIHTGEKPYRCKKCSKAFAQTGQLQIHVNKKRPCLST